MKKKIKEWLGIELIEKNITKDLITLSKAEAKILSLERELNQCMKFIGALYDYLGVRPQKTFTEDFSRLPEENPPTIEIIRAEKVKKLGR